MANKSWADKVLNFSISMCTSTLLCDYRYWTQKEVKQCGVFTEEKKEMKREKKKGKALLLAGEHKPIKKSAHGKGC